MPLPPDFHFSQNCLRDYLACPRRFQLRYIEHLAWPAIEVEPYLEHEEHLRRGSLFHRLAEQYLKGIPGESLAPLAEENNLAEWWRAFLEFHATLLPGDRMVEWTLYLHLEGYTLVAKYDLVILTNDGKCILYDWKTTLNRPKSMTLQSDIQTRLYLLLAAESVRLKNGKSFQPEKLSMNYWFAAFPHEPEMINYSPSQQKQDQVEIVALIEQIMATPADGFILTSDERLCRFCIYRSYCERGVGAGPLDEFEDNTSSIDDTQPFDFDQISEISF